MSTANFTFSSTQKPRIPNYDTKRMEAFKAVERDIPHGEPRTPTHYWAGLDLSKTSPFALETNEMSRWTHREELRPLKLHATTTHLHAIDAPTQDRSDITQFTDIHSLLTHLKLEHYISKKAVQTFVASSMSDTHHSSQLC